VTILTHFRELRPGPLLWCALTRYIIRSMQTIVIGHRNPDMDSICSAIAYAELKRKLGMADVVAARAGNTNERIDFVLQRFGVPAPDFVSDLAPKVADLMETKVISVPHDSSIYQAITSIEESKLRGLPVVDAEDRCLGLLSGWKISHYLFPPRDEALNSRLVLGAVTDIVQSFNGQYLAGQPDSSQRRLIIMVAAMSLESFAGRLKREDPAEIVLFVGDREDVQLAAINAGTLAVVVTGGMGVSAKVRAAAKEAGTRLVSSRFDTGTSVILSRGAVRVEQMIDPEFTSFSPETPIRAARQVAANSSEFVFPVLDAQNRLVGILSKSGFLRPVPRQLILVDHNELSQAVKGAAELPIIEVLDHHRVNSFTTDVPILFWNNPVGSTSTLVALSYQQLGIKIDPPIAGLLMAGLISDTLNLTSPTATPIDTRVLDDLSRIAGVTPAKLAEEIFAVGSPLRTLSSKEVITTDCKDYEEGEFRFSVSQIEELSFSYFADKQEELFRALEEYRRSQNAYFSALLITDVNTQNSLLLVAAPSDFLNTIHYPNLAPNLYELQGVVSRKKQLVPYLLDCLQKVKASIS
jgi:manganese-dependent inorganic pyrophosphatase